jgi:hypothetical protein
MSKNKVKLKSSKGDISITIENNLKANQNTAPPVRRRRKRNISSSGGGTLQDILRGGAAGGGRTLGGGGLPPPPRPTVDVSYIRPPPQSYSIWNDTTVPNLNNVGVGYAQAQQMGLINAPQPQPQPQTQPSNPLAQFKPKTKDVETQLELNDTFTVDPFEIGNRYENSETQSELSAEDLLPRYTNNDPLNTTFKPLDSTDFSQQSRYLTNDEAETVASDILDGIINDATSYRAKEAATDILDGIINDATNPKPANKQDEEQSPYEKGYDRANSAITQATLYNKELAKETTFKKGFRDYILYYVTGVEPDFTGKTKKYMEGYNRGKSSLVPDKFLDKQEPEFKKGYIDMLQEILTNTNIKKSKSKSKSKTLELGFLDAPREEDEDYGEDTDFAIAKDYFDSEVTMKQPNQRPRRERKQPERFRP